MKIFSIVALAMGLAACASVNTKFVYKPGSSGWGDPKLPVKVAVLAFEDGTADFLDTDCVEGGKIINLAKGGYAGNVTSLPPEIWAKGFADDLAASGVFDAVRFYYSPSELTGEDFYIEGTVEKAYAFGSWIRPNEFALGLRAFRRSDKHPIWEKVVAHSWISDKGPHIKCGMNMQCGVDLMHADANRVMGKLFAEAGADLVKTLASLSTHRAGEGVNPPAGSPALPSPESVDETIEEILRGK